MDGQSQGSRIMTTTYAMIVVGWLACSVASYYLVRAWWLREVDLRRSDRTQFIAVSLLLGPMHLLIALGLWLIQIVDDMPRAKDIVASRRRI